MPRSGSGRIGAWMPDAQDREEDEEVADQVGERRDGQRHLVVRRDGDGREDERAADPDPDRARGTRGPCAPA